MPRTEYQPRPEFSMAQYQADQYSEDTLNRLYIRDKYGYEDDFDKDQRVQRSKKELQDEKLDRFLHQREMATEYIGYGDPDKVWSKQTLQRDPRTHQERERQENREKEKKLDEKVANAKANYVIIERSGEVLNPKQSVLGYGGVPTRIDFDFKNYDPRQFEY